MIGGRLLAPGAPLPAIVSFPVNPAVKSPGLPSRRRGTAGPDSTFPSPDTIDKPGYDEAQQVNTSDSCSGFKNWDGQNPGDVTKLGIGFQAWDTCQGIYQSYYVFNVSGVKNAWTIENITLNLTEVESSWNACSSPKEPIYLHSLGNNGSIGPNTDGANTNVLGSASGKNEIDVAPADNPNTNDGCVSRDADFNVTGDTQDIQHSSGSYTFGVSGDNSDNPNAGQFMRLSDNPTMVIIFDETPPNPTMQQSSPAMVDSPGNPDTNFGCQSSSDSTPQIPWIGASNAVTLNADFEAALTDEEVKPGWDIWNDSGTIVNKTFGNTAAGTSGFTFNSPVDGDEYFSQENTTVNGNGGQGGFDPGYTSGNINCSFALDTTLPTGPTVTSTDFPPIGTTPGTTQQVPGAEGTFSFSASDPAPSGCASSSPIASAGYGAGATTSCLASGVYEFEYSLNQPLPANPLPITTTCPSGGLNEGAVAAVNPTGNPTTNPSANPSATTTGSSCEVGISQWGTNILYVGAVDASGNLGRTYEYEFYVPFNEGAKPVAGAVFGDTPDLLVTSGNGSLVYFPDGQDPADGPPEASPAAGAPGNATNWTGLMVAHRGSFEQGLYDDLLVLNPTQNTLYTYFNANNSNTGSSPTDMFDKQANSLSAVTLPACVSDPDNSSNCTGYPTQWSAFNQIVGPNDAWQGDSAGQGITMDSQFPGLLAVTSSGSLWLFQGTGGGLANPVKLGGSGWNNVSLMFAGPVNGQKTVWARFNSGANAGEIVSFPLVPSSSNGVPTLDPGSPGTMVSPTSAVGTTLVDSSGNPIIVPPGLYPTVTAAGPLTAAVCSATNLPACPGFFAEDTAGAEFYYAGQPTTNPADALAGTSQLVGNVNGASAAPSPSPVIDSVTGNLEVYATEAEGTLDQDVYNEAAGNFTGWNGLAGSITGSPSPVFNTGSGNLEVYATGTDGTLDERYYKSDGTGWSAWKSLGQPTTGAITGSPSAVFDTASGNLEVYMTGADGSLWEEYWIPGSGWSPWKNLGAPATATITGSPSAVYNTASGNLEVYCTGSDGALWEIYHSSNGWSAWKSLGGDITGSPSAVYDPIGKDLEVYATGADDTIDETEWAPGAGWTGPTSLGGSVTGSPSAVYDGVRSAMEVYATGLDGTLDYDLWTKASGWAGVTSLAGSLISSPSAIYDQTASKLDIYAVGTAGALEQIAYRGSTQNWGPWTNLHGNLAG